MYSKGDIGGLEFFQERHGFLNSFGGPIFNVLKSGSDLNDRTVFIDFRGKQGIPQAYRNKEDKRDKD